MMVYWDVHTVLAAVKRYEWITDADVADLKNVPISANISKATSDSFDHKVRQWMAFRTARDTREF